jgi:hypothetical protein
MKSRRHGWSEPHTISVDEMVAHLAQHQWHHYASSSREPKYFDVRIGAPGFRVTVGDDEIYCGTDPAPSGRVQTLRSREMMRCGIQA